MIIAQISDTHIASCGSLADHRFSAAARLEQVVCWLSRMHAVPDLVLLTGDCVDIGKTEEYDRLCELLHPLKMPVYVVPGNHDRRDQLRDAFGFQGDRAMKDFVQFVVEDWPIRIIGVDTHLPGSFSGRICSERLEWLEERLSEVNRTTIIFLHHPPFKSGLNVLDSIGLQGSEELRALINRHTHVERILAGHLHRTMIHRFGSTIALSCPSTAHRIHLDLQDTHKLGVIMEPPSCLLHVWKEETGLVTHEVFIGDHGPVTEIHDGSRWLT